MNGEKYTAVMLVILQSTLYGLGDPISKVAFEAVPVYSLLSVRYVIALAVIMLFAGKRVVTETVRSSPKDWLLPSLCMGGAYVANNIALELTAATSVAFIRSLSTVMTPLLVLVIFRRKYNRKHIPIQIAVIAGLYLLCGYGGLSGFGAGEIFSLLSALLIAGSLVFGEDSLKRMDPITITALQTAASAVMALICAPVFEGGWDFSGADFKVWSIIVYLAVGCTVGGYLLQNAALVRTSSQMVALVQCSCPVITAFFSWLILGESLSAAGVAGVIIILFCIAADTMIKDEAHEVTKSSVQPK